MQFSNTCNFTLNLHSTAEIIYHIWCDMGREKVFSAVLEPGLGMFLTLRWTGLLIILKKIYREFTKLKDKIKRILLTDSKYGGITNDSAIAHKNTNRN